MFTKSTSHSSHSCVAHSETENTMPLF
uniref:Uncharacterized protein n=1 Tax=Anguilla anguilla TaxID=7936 RepID=A0A0E9SZN7_ANGAN